VSLRRFFQPRQERLVDALELTMRARGFEKADEPHHTPQSPYGDSEGLFDATKALIEAADYPDPTDFGSDLVLQWLDEREQAGDPIPYRSIAGKKWRAWRLRSIALRV
jgi:hypothetical protein